MQAGIARERIVVDPGFGFGKTLEHNLELLRRLNEFSALGLPVLAGLVAQVELGKLTGRPADERLRRSLAAALLALQGGATILRVHDVKATRDVIAVWQAYREALSGDRKYFGTDGVRGTVGQSPMTPDFVLRLGYAAGKVLAGQSKHPAVLIGKDTRISGYMLESALEAGLLRRGRRRAAVRAAADAGVAYLTRALRLSAGVVISASHNPYADNGIKFFSGDGFKLPDATEAAIEREMEQPMGCNESAKLGKRAARRRRRRPLHRVLQVDLPQRARPEGHAHRGRLRARRGVQHRAARVPRARRRSGRRSASSPTASTSTSRSARPRRPALQEVRRAGRPRHRARRRRRPRADGRRRRPQLRRRPAAVRGRQAPRGGKEKVAGVAGTLMTNFAFEKAMARLGIRLRARQGRRPLRARAAAREGLAARRRELRPPHLPRQAHHRRRHRLGAAGAAARCANPAARSPS